MQLDMPKIRFVCEFSGQTPQENGLDAVRFLMSANVGEALRPLSKVASGGELARIMLAMKNVLAAEDSVGTMIFDEVDAGVSGRAAQKVAYKLWTVAKGRQVLCVTHLPQIAAMADTEFTVEKRVENERTYTSVLRLDAAAMVSCALLCLQHRTSLFRPVQLLSCHCLPHWRQHDHRNDAGRRGGAAAPGGTDKEGSLT